MSASPAAPACRSPRGRHPQAAQCMGRWPNIPDAEAVDLREVSCLSVCNTGCAAAISMPGKWSYLLGGLAPELAGDLLAYARLYTRAPNRHGAALEARAQPGAHGGGEAAGMKIPCTVITGFLGAGKTTLVRHVLAHAQGRRIAILVNEFGSLGIDGETPALLRHPRLRGRRHRGTGQWLPVLHRGGRVPAGHAGAAGPAQPAGAHPDRDVRPGAAQAAAEGVRLAGHPRPA